MAEDNKINQMIVKKVLLDWNTHVEFADNGLIALQMLKSSDFDLILMDIQMPEMDGYTTVEKIRSEFPEPTCKIPIIAMTAHAISTEKQKCLDAKMDDYISKPFEPAILKKKILALTKSSNPSLKEHPPEKNSINNSFLNLKNNFTKDSNSSTGSDGLSANNAADKIIQYSASHPKINLSYLKRIAEGNDTFVIEMIEMFLNKTPQALEQLNECYRKHWR